MGWSIDKMEGVTSFNQQTGKAVFEPNTTEQDRIYIVTYTDELGGTGSMEFKVPNCPEPCENEWNLELIGAAQIYAQDYEGTGGTPIIVSVKFNGEKVEGLTENDFVLNIGSNGMYNEIFSGLMIFTAGEDYGIRIDKTSKEITCPYVGETLECTLAPTACTEAKVEFKITITEKDNWETKITGLPAEAASMSLGYCCELATCGKHLKLEFDDFVYNSSDGTLFKVTPLYKDINLDALSIVSVSQLPSGYNQAPYCFRIDEISFPYIKLHYCTNCTEQNPCNPNYENNCQ